MRLEALARRILHRTGQLDLSMQYITMFDDITVHSMPTGGSYAYAGYTDGMWPTFPELVRRFPGHRLLDIAVFASDNATCLDIEKGDATVDEAPAWYERQVQRGVYRPVLYTSADNLRDLERVMAAAHISREHYRIWSAHYGPRAHLCGPRSCGFGLSVADGTQWTARALGLDLDQSILLPDFFDPRPAPPAPKPTPTPAPAVPPWQEAMMNALPTLKQGDKDVPGKIEFVGRMQSLIRYIGNVNAIEAAKDLVVDGDFGMKTTNALLAVQSFAGLHNSKEFENRVCGPDTWPFLVSGAK